jgi:hypothetical protein
LLKFDKISGKSIFEIIFEEIEKIKIIDPAVGSGAFPMGILQEMSSMLWYLGKMSENRGRMSENGGGMSENGGEMVENRVSLYEIKKKIIQNNIFGVDIEP